MQPAAIPLGDIIADYALQYARIFPSLRDVIIIPIPLSKKRERERGFNQSRLIAKQFGKIFGFAYDPGRYFSAGSQQKSRKPKPIASRRTKTKHYCGCFAVRRAGAGRMILVDDVVTTGSTFREADPLRAAGKKA